LLIDRSYYLAYEENEKVPDGPDGISLRYSVGQPMGALSSFNMLAVTHHFLVQLAYQRTIPLYKKYNIFIFSGGIK